MNENNKSTVFCICFHVCCGPRRARSPVIYNTLLKWKGVRSPGKLQIEQSSERVAVRAPQDQLSAPLVHLLKQRAPLVVHKDITDRPETN